MVHTETVGLQLPLKIGEFGILVGNVLSEEQNIASVELAEWFGNSEEKILSDIELVVEITEATNMFLENFRNLQLYATRPGYPLIIMGKVVSLDHLELKNGLDYFLIIPTGNIDGLGGPEIRIEKYSCEEANKLAESVESWVSILSIDQLTLLSGKVIEPVYQLSENDDALFDNIFFLTSDMGEF